jgi:hypothetical protein
VEGCGESAGEHSLGLRYRHEHASAREAQRTARKRTKEATKHASAVHHLASVLLSARSDKTLERIVRVNAASNASACRSCLRALKLCGTNMDIMRRKAQA